MVTMMMLYIDTSFNTCFFSFPIDQAPFSSQPYPTALVVQLLRRYCGGKSRASVDANLQAYKVATST